ncbi:hypothetical protein [Endozoicomonas sp. ALB091]|uniref:hypothetical protein n=1 Tax=Endozoicomonas sp. ALB091 TaxID=3403073 RepID=UPI003BB8159E
MKIYADYEIRLIANERFGRDYDFSLDVTEKNIAELQEALECDTDCDLRLKVGWCFVKNGVNAIELHSNNTMGYGGGGTDVIALIL